MITWQSIVSCFQNHFVWQDYGSKILGPVMTDASESPPDDFQINKKRMENTERKILHSFLVNFILLEDG